MARGKVKAETENPKLEKVAAKTSTGEQYLAENLEMLTKIGFETSKTIDLMAVELERSQASDKLLMANMATLNTLAQAARVTAQNIDFLRHKMESMASHLVAVEEVLAEIAPAANLNMAKIVGKIRTKIAAGTDGKGDPARSIDIATLLISK